MIRFIIAASIGVVLAVSTAASSSEASSVTTYGQTVDTTDSVPAAPGVAPPASALPRRPEGSLAFSGNYSLPFPGSLGGDYLMFFQGQNVTVVGEGYFMVRWEVAWFNDYGALVPPRWTGVSGKLFHVASAGWHRMDDRNPSANDPTQTWMGPANARDTIPPGTQQMWQNEYYYVDGSVTLWDDESSVDYNLSVTPTSAAGIQTDVDSSGAASSGFVRFGIIRDNGTDAAPVPQYATRQNLTQYSQLEVVPQQSELEVPVVSASPSPKSTPQPIQTAATASPAPGPLASPSPTQTSTASPVLSGSSVGPTDPQLLETTYATTPLITVRVGILLMILIITTIGALQTRRSRDRRRAKR